MSDGRRKLISLSELSGMEGDVITMQEIFRFRQTGVSTDGMVQGRFEATGIRPRFLEQVMAHGVTPVARPVPPGQEFRSMSDIWLRAIVLILVFAAVVFAVERILSRSSSGAGWKRRRSTSGST